MAFPNGRNSTTRMHKSGPSSHGAIWPRTNRSTIALFKKAAPSVVHITNLAVRRDLNQDIFGIPQGTRHGIHLG